jgi:ATP-dependent DNA helicase 2 subunit 1
LSNINSKSAPRRAFFTVPFEIGPGLKIGVKGYMVIKRQEPKRTCYVWTDGEKVQLVHGSTTMLAEDTARTVEKVEVKKAFKFGGDSILFTDEELKKIKNFGEPVMRIVGFKDLKLLPIWATTKHPSFIYPSEQDFVGSIRVFSALQQNMLKKKKFALVWFQPRRNAFPILAAAVASAEKLGDNGEQVSPPGIWVRALPFADDVRQNPETTVVRAPEPLIDLMRIVVQQLQLPKAIYDPRKYPNPALQWHYRILQALALDEDVPETPEDKTLPRYRQIDKRVGDRVIEWGQELEEQYQTWLLNHGHRSKPAADTKKRSADSSSAPAAKKAKVASSSGGTSVEEMRERFEKNSIDKLTISVLKEWCAGRSLVTTGKKAELVERVQEYFESKQ